MIKRWKKIRSKNVYDCGSHYFITKDLVTTPGNQIVDYYVVRRASPVIVIIPIDKDGFIYMTRQHRYPVDEYSLEFPSGGSEKDETPLHAAKRELLEETGFSSKNWKRIAVIHEANGISDIRDFVFIAESIYPKICHQKDPLDINLHKVMRFRYQDIRKQISKNIIVDSLTISAFAIADTKGLLNKYI
jgi:8-oxo-dGTP pyrophosphatase MutT (NUDIX family)